MACVFACDIDAAARRAYQANFGITPAGDITAIDPAAIPPHDILLAGFPCQPFSIIGARRGFADARGTLFFNLAEIIAAQRPQAFLLENVRQLSTHNQGKTLQRMLDLLADLGYNVHWQRLNALDFGLPQKRERVFIVGFREAAVSFTWPEPVGEYIPLQRILEPEVAKSYYASPRIRRKRQEKHQSALGLSIWHENKGGNIASHPYSCALRAGASYNYLLVNGERRLTPREMLRLQGFPDWFALPGSYQEIRKQTGNAVPVPMVRAVLAEMLEGLAATATVLPDRATAMPAGSTVLPAGSTVIPAQAGIQRLLVEGAAA